MADILKVTGYQQLCADLESGCRVVDLFEEDTIYGFIQIDASNASDLINRTLLLHNVKLLCPKIATYINNCYMKPPRFVHYRWEKDLVKRRNHPRRPNSNGDLSAGFNATTHFKY